MATKRKRHKRKLAVTSALTGPVVRRADDDGTHVIALPMRTVSEANDRAKWDAVKRAKLQRHTVATFLRVMTRVPSPLIVTMTRVAPRELDNDNLARALKAVRDGIADAYSPKLCKDGKVRGDDSDDAITYRYEQHKDGKRYAVEIEIVPRDYEREWEDRARSLRQMIVQAEREIRSLRS